MAAFNFPNSPSTNQIHTENGVSFIWDGSSWKKNPASLAKGQKGAQGPAGPPGTSGQKGGAGSTPVGQILAWSGSASSLPTGYLLCNGSAVSRSTYSALFAIVGTTHGNGNGSTTFNLPDLTDKFIVGADTSTGDTSYPGLSVGGSGGSADATIPSHYHNFPGDDQLTFANGVAGWSNTTDGNFSYDATSNASGGGKLWRTTTTGSSATNANLPPYYALAFIIQFAEGGLAAKGQKGDTGAGAGPPGPAGPPGISGSAGATNIQTFTSNGTYNPTAGTKTITVYCVAGGGGSAYVEGNSDSEGGDFFDRSAGGGGGGACVGYYNLTGSFSANVSVGNGGTGGVNIGQEAGGSGGESKFTPSGQYSGSGTLDAGGGGGGSANGVNPGGGGASSGGSIVMVGDLGENRGSYYPGKGGRAGYVFGTYGGGARGSGPTTNSQNGNAGYSGIVVVYEYL